MARKYELETIPIWDAFDADIECPLCLLDERSEKHYLDFFLGNSVMIPEMRVEVNKTGFCRSHFVALWKAASNKHPLSLMVHTHLKDVISKLAAKERPLKAAGSATGRLLTRRIATLIAHLRRRSETCMICDRLAYSLDRYTFTIVYLWNNKEDFRKAFSESKGFCTYHLTGLMEMAREQLGSRRLAGFMAEIVGLQQSSMKRLESELLWYTQKFDYQNSDKPWGTSKDALHRALQKITGRIYRD